MKKSLLITLEFPPQAGGVSTYYYNVCKHLPADKIVVLAPEQEGSDKFDQKQNFTIIRSKLLTKLAKPKKMKVLPKVEQFKVVKLLKQTCKTHDIAILQVGHILPLGTATWLFKKTSKIPYILYAHGLDILVPQKSIRKKIIAKKIIQSAYKIICNSNFTRVEINKLGSNDEKNLVVNPCPNSLEHKPSDWKVDELKEELEVKGKKVLLTVSRIVERKGHDMIIKAMPDIIKKFPSVVYLIAGRGPNQEKLEKLVNELSLRDYVKFIGFIPDETLPALYDICDIFVMPSRQIGPDVEGFGITYLEANTFAKPVIGGNSGGVPEAINHHHSGILVDPNDQREITYAIMDLLSDKAKAERMGMQGLEMVIEHFNWEAQTKKIKAILE